MFSISLFTVPLLHEVNLSFQMFFFWKVGLVDDGKETTEDAAAKSTDNGDDNDTGDRDDFKLTLSPESNWGDDVSCSASHLLASLVALNARLPQSTPMPRGEDNLPPSHAIKRK